MSGKQRCGDGLIQTHYVIRDSKDISIYIKNKYLTGISLVTVLSCEASSVEQTMVTVQHWIGGPESSFANIHQVGDHLSIFNYNILLPNSVDGWWK